MKNDGSDLTLFDWVRSKSPWLVSISAAIVFGLFVLDGVAYGGRGYTFLCNHSPVWLSEGIGCPARDSILAQSPREPNRLKYERQFQEYLVSVKDNDKRHNAHLEQVGFLIRRTDLCTAVDAISERLYYGAAPRSSINIFLNSIGKTTVCIRDKGKSTVRSMVDHGTILGVLLRNSMIRVPDAATSGLGWEVRQGFCDWKKRESSFRRHARLIDEYIERHGADRAFASHLESIVWVFSRSRNVKRPHFITYCQNSIKSLGSEKSFDNPAHQLALFSRNACVDWKKAAEMASVRAELDIARDVAIGRLQLTIGAKPEGELKTKYLNSAIAKICEEQLPISSYRIPVSIFKESLLKWYKVTAIFRESAPNAKN